MTEPGDAMLPERPVASTSAAFPAAPDATACAQSPAQDDRAARRAALRDLAAMIGVEVFY